MKIVTIIGSPKGKGTGYEIAKKVEEIFRSYGAAAEYGDAAEYGAASTEFEYIFLKEQNIAPCKGCFLCVTRGEDMCPLHDDRTTIEETIENADGVILVSPCYVSNVTALMKNFMDRMCYTNHRPRFFRQKLLLISNAGAGMEETIKALRLALGSGPRVVGEIAYLSPPWPLAPHVDQKQDDLIQKRTAAFYHSIRKDLSRGGLPEKPTFAEYLRFRFFKKISVDTREYLKADYEYYRHLKDYYYDTNISLFLRFAASAALKLGMLFMKDLAPATVTSAPQRVSGTPRREGFSQSG